MLGHHPGTDGHTYTGRQQRPRLYTASRGKNPENDGNVQIDFAVATNGTRMAKLQNLSPPCRKHSKLCVRPIRIAFFLVRPQHSAEFYVKYEGGANDLHVLC